MSVASIQESTPHLGTGDPSWMIHTFPAGSQIGDRALCGWVKRTSLQLKDVPPRQRVRCVVCAHLKAGR
jgi:hypothetical protein